MLKHNILFYTPMKVGSTSLYSLFEKSPNFLALTIQDYGILLNCNANIYDFTSNVNVVVKEHSVDRYNLSTLLNIMNRRFDYNGFNKSEHYLPQTLIIMVRKPTDIYPSLYFHNVHESKCMGDGSPTIEEYYYGDQEKILNTSIDNLVSHFNSFDWERINCSDFDHIRYSIMNLCDVDIYQANTDDMKNKKYSIQSGKIHAKYSNSDDKFYKINVVIAQMELMNDHDNLKNMLHDIHIDDNEINNMLNHYIKINSVENNSDEKWYGNMYNEFKQKLHSNTDYINRYNYIDNMIMEKFYCQPKLPQKFACIFGLVKGFDTIDEYHMLRLRNKLLHENFNKKFNYDMILFHEGNITKEHQKIMMDETPNLQFININHYFRTSLENKKAHEKGNINDRDIGFKHMCRFNSIYVYKTLSNYKYIMRADDDILIRSNIDIDLFDFMNKNGIIFGYGRLKIDDHLATNNTFPLFVSEYIKKNLIKSNCDETEINCKNFYNNFYITSTDFWFRDDVQKFLYSVEKSQNIYCYRWGDSPIQAMALKIFSHHTEWFQFTNFAYTHASHNWTNYPTVHNEWTITPDKYVPKNNYVFIHIDKTAGSSITRSLDSNIMTNSEENGNVIMKYKHCTAIEWQTILGSNNFAKLFKFTVVRNPYDRVLSKYRFSRYVKQEPIHDIP